jgi:hypothetical protein
MQEGSSMSDRIEIPESGESGGEIVESSEVAVQVETATRKYQVSHFRFLYLHLREPWNRGQPNQILRAK